MKNCSVFASLISPSKMILFEKKYQTFDTVFHHQMKHLEVRQKYSAARRIFNSLLGVSSGDETLRLMFEALSTKPILGGGFVCFSASEFSAEAITVPTKVVFTWHCTIFQVKLTAVRSGWGVQYAF